MPQVVVPGPVVPAQDLAADRRSMALPRAGVAGVAAGMPGQFSRLQPIRLFRLLSGLVALVVRVLVE